MANLTYTLVQSTSWIGARNPDYRHAVEVRAIAANNTRALRRGPKPIDKGAKKQRRKAQRAARRRNR